MPLPVLALALRRLLLRGLPLLGLMGCHATEAVDPPGYTGRTGLAVTLALDAKTDVTGMRFTLDRMSCSGEAIQPFHQTVDKALEDIRLPGGLPGFEDAPLDGNSSHTFADLFLVLTQGCYRVSTQPLAAGGALSVDCAKASTSGVRIEDGRTTEILLINQCRAEGRGGIDVVSGLNHPPELQTLTFEDSKFVLQCAPQVVCATVKDPDGDPLEFVWTKANGPALYTGPEVLRTTTATDGSVTQCVRVVAETVGRYELNVTVFDLLHDTAAGGKLIRIEDYFTRVGDPHPSRETLTFPFYAAEDGIAGGCRATSCKEVLQRTPRTASGLYSIDPDGTGPLAPFDVYCDMVTNGGGWTLTMVSSDDNQATWTWNQRTLMTNATPVGNVSARNKDFKSPAQYTVPFTDLLFVHAPSGVWAAYAGVSKGSPSIASHMAAINAPVCDLNLADKGHPLTAGSLQKAGQLCDTDLYFHLGDFDGYGSVPYCQASNSDQDSTYGPAWSIGTNNGCPFDDPSGASFGPDVHSTLVNSEGTAAGFGGALGLNTGAPGAAQNYIQMYVR